MIVETKFLFNLPVLDIRNPEFFMNYVDLWDEWFTAFDGAFKDSEYVPGDTFSYGDISFEVTSINSKDDLMKDVDNIEAVLSKCTDDFVTKYNLARLAEIYAKKEYYQDEMRENNGILNPHNDKRNINQYHRIVNVFDHLRVRHFRSLAHKNNEEGIT